MMFELLAKLVNNITVEILHCDYYIGDSRWRYYNISSPFNRLYFMVAGEGRAELAQQTFRLLPGRMYVIPSNIKFSIICDDYIEKFYIHFRAELFPGHDIFDAIQTCFSKPMESSWLNTFLALARSSNAPDIIRFKSMLLDIISDFADEISPDSSSKLELTYKYRHVYRFINSNASAMLTARTVADSLGLSYSNLVKTYKKDTGLTLNEYIHNVLLRLSIEKLLFTEMTIKEIAYLLKFSDEFYFSRFFKRYTGMSPKNYRSLYRPIP